MFDVISAITGSRIAPDPALAILSLGIELIPPALRHVVLNLLMAARLSITRKWKDDLPPTITEVIDLTNLHCSHEQLLASSLGRLAKVTALWTPWSVWFTNSKEFPVV